MVALGLWGLARQDTMGNDEVATHNAAALSLGELAHLLSNLDAVHGTYYLLMHVWALAFGLSPTVLRIPSVIAMAAGAALIVITGRRVTGSAWAGLVAGVIMALTPTISYYAQTARSYAMVLAVVVAASLALARVLEAEAAGEPRRRVTWWWALYTVLVILASYLNEMALLILAAHAVTVLLARHGRPVFERFVIAAVVSGVVVAPLALLSVKERDAVGWIPRPDLRQVGILYHDYFGGTTLIATIIFAFAVVALLPPPGWFRRAGRAPGVRAGLREGRPPGADTAWWELRGVSVQSLALPLVTLPAGLLMAESVVGHPLYVDRYVLYGEAGGALLAGAGAYRIGRWLARHAGRLVTGQGLAARVPLTAVLVVPGLVACLCALLLNFNNQRGARTPDSRLYDFGDPSFYLGAHARAGDGVLFFNEFYRKIEYAYPADFRHLTDFAVAQTPQQAGTFNGTDKALPAVKAAMLGYRRIWVVGNPPSPYLAGPDFRAESLLLISDYRLAAQQNYKGMSVTLWVRKTP